MGVARLTPLMGGAVAKASLNRALKLLPIDPKPSELPLDRVNFE